MRKRGFRQPADLPAECASLQTQIGAGEVREEIIVGRAAHLLQQRAAHHQAVRRKRGGARGDGRGRIIARNPLSRGISVHRPSSSAPT